MANIKMFSKVTSKILDIKAQKTNAEIQSSLQGPKPIKESKTRNLLFDEIYG
jgi:hypothetical protein